MALQPVGAMIRTALRQGYAVGYFESWSLESLQGVIDAAEQTRSPVLVGFNGHFLSWATRRAGERLALYAALGRAAAETAKVPCGLVFNECPQDDRVREAVAAGFNLVMPSDPDAEPEQLVRRVAELAKFAHAHGVSIEAELGELPCGASGEAPTGGSATDPAAAAAFVEATAIDLLAVSVGNVHIRVKGRQGLDLGLLEKIRKRVAVPLVLHGGSGIEDDALREAIALGVAKVNYGTALKQRYLDAVRRALACDLADPHRLIGRGGPDDALMAGRVAVREAVLERIALLGCAGIADTRGND